MSAFQSERGALACDGVALAAIADRVGTPVYVYSARAIEAAYRALDAGFGPYPHRIHYALKANSSLGLIRLLRGLGSGVDANSGGEIEVALRAGFTPAQIVFTGVGKTSAELDRAVTLGVAAINVESAGELDRVAGIARARGTTARIAVRVNPDIDAGSHPHISTGLKTSKFGIPFDEAAPLYRALRADGALEPVGLHVHVGSQITSLEPLRRAARTVAALARALRDEGIPLEHLDLGGGLGISYDGATVPDLTAYAETLVDAVRDSGLAIVVEPGRALVGPAGALVSQVIDIKQFPGPRTFAVLDAGMTELMRPSLYGAYHRIVPVAPRAGDERSYDIVGPLCESSDVFGRDRALPPLEPGDLVAVFDAGAYGSAMASNYNRRLLPPEVLVVDGRPQVIRRRQTVDDLLALEEEA